MISAACDWLFHSKRWAALWARNDTGMPRKDLDMGGSAWRDWICVSRLEIRGRGGKLDHREPVVDSSGPLLSAVLAADMPTSVDLCWCSYSEKTATSRAFGARFAGIAFIRRDRVVAAVTARPLLTSREAVAGHSIRATEMLKAVRKEALRAFRKPLKRGQGARLACHVLKVRFLLNA